MNPLVILRDASGKGETMSDKPTTSFEFVCVWFRNAITQAKKQNRQDSAALWQDGLSHLEHQQLGIERLRTALRAISEILIPEQDNIVAANMRKAAITALG